VPTEVEDGGVKEGFDGRVFDRRNHSLSLPVGPAVVGLCLTCSIPYYAYRAEEMIDEPTFGTLVKLHELNPVVREYGVDFIGYRFDQSLEETGCYKFRRLAIDPGDDDLRSAIDGNEEKCLATLVSQLSNVDVEIADFV
jgi:hypothetical protein